MKKNMKNPLSKPNFLVIMVDEQRYPTSYEDTELTLWRKKFLKAQESLKNTGVEFKNHYASSTACSPSRASLYTGQYPSLHGVSQTTGAAKVDFEPGMFWLDENTVPTIGDYFKNAGYKTYWKGKWHASAADILIPDTQDSYLTYNAENGVPLKENEDIYIKSNRLGEYGFNDWVGPEPFSGNPRNSGSSASIGLSGRDVIYAQEVSDLIKELDENKSSKPWFIMCSFVNPHDIALYGDVTKLDPLYNFKIDPSVPFIPKAPTAHELLLTKPSAQRSYKEVYPQALQPLEDTLFYRQLYYSLQLQVDKYMQQVLNTLKASSFYENTIIVFTSDHGDLLGSHGGLFQKWYQAYEESIHVPFIISNPILFKEKQSRDLLTSHVDILPTLLGLANINPDIIQEKLKTNHTEVRSLVGKDLTPAIIDLSYDNLIKEPVYFMTDDNFTKGINQTNLLGNPYTSVIQPNSIQTVIAKLPTGEDNTDEIWKYSLYFDNPQFWSTPGCKDEVTTKTNETTISSDTICSTCVTTTKTTPISPELEMYNLTKDPTESNNLANPQFTTPKNLIVQLVLEKLLEEQCLTKRLYPNSGNVPGKPPCPSCAPDYKV